MQTSDILSTKDFIVDKISIIFASKSKPNPLSLSVKLIGKTKIRKVLNNTKRCGYVYKHPAYFSSDCPFDFESEETTTFCNRIENIPSIVSVMDCRSQTKREEEMKKQKEILVPHGTKARLKKDTGYSETTIKFALRGAIDTEIAKTIRKRALEMGGVLARQ